MPSFAAGVAYIGTQYSGWQAQVNGLGIANVLDAALSQIANHPVSTVCAGRTDAGVHALQQVVHFSIDTQRTSYQLLQGVNTYLPEDIAVLWVSEVDDSFSARFSATARHYRYWFLRGEVASPHYVHRALHVKQSLDIEAMQLAANGMYGERDFSVFRSSDCQAAHANRCLLHCTFTEVGDVFYLDIIANAFLHHMVRFTVGGLLAVGVGKVSVPQFLEMVASKVRPAWVTCVAPSGLYFVRPIYPESIDLPDFSLFDPLTQSPIVLKPAVVPD